jgi:hypothetical protein
LAVATLNFSTTSDRKVFTPISSALANLPNGAGTMIFLVKKTVIGAADFGGLMLGASSDWYHVLWQFSGGALSDDDGQVGAASLATAPNDTTNWYLFAVDWPASAALETFHWRNQTTQSTWTHSNSNANVGAPRAGPTTAAGWFHIGSSGEGTAATKLMGIAAVWAGTRFANTDYGSWTKTSDLWNHSLGHPTLLVELNTTTPVDLAAGSTYSSGNSSGTALTGADPDNWDFDGKGGGVSSFSSASGPGLLGMFTPQMRSDAWF